MMNGRAAVWLSQHLPWIVVAVMLLWAPPVLFNLAVNLRLVPAPSGYPGWRDPEFLLPLIELSVLAASVRPLLRCRRAGWLMLVWSRVAVAGQTAWTLVLVGRLEGYWTTLTRRTMLEALAGLAIAAVLLPVIRPLYNGGAVAPRE